MPCAPPGSAHLLAISGLHMALVAGSVFWLIRALLALSPGLALNYPIKKWAAVGALLFATVYLGISGARVATLRAWVMLAIMLAAILLDRRALTLRNVALAALIILVFSPESLLSISFQMSFAATVALIAAYQALAERPRRAVLADTGDPTAGRLRRTLFALFVTSLVAGAATAPFAIFYFQRLAPLTVVANMAVAPAVGLVVMPMALLSVLAMPFGLEVFPLARHAVGAGMGARRRRAHRVMVVGHRQRADAAGVRDPAGRRWFPVAGALEGALAACRAGADGARR